MTSKMILSAAVAGLAILPPAQAQRPDRAEREQQRAEKSQQRAEQPQQQKARAERPQRQEGEQARAERPQRQERAQVERPQRQERVRMERPQPQEQVRMERPRRQERASLQRPQRQEEVRIERPQREQRVRAERVQREQRVRTERAERVRSNRVQREQRAQRVWTERVERVQTEQVQRERVNKREQRSAERVARRNVKTQRLDRVQDRKAQRFDRQAQRFDRQAERHAQKFDFQHQLRDGRLERQQARIQQRQALRTIEPQYSVGTRYDVAENFSSNWYNQVAAQRYQTSISSTPDYFYDYDSDDGYLYQVDRSSNLVSAAYPLLGGAFGVGQMLPLGYDSYNLPYGYRSLYHDTPDYSYRYGDGAIYRVDSTTQLVSAVVALLSGQRFGVGQMLPVGFDTYNVPFAYRDDYFDSNDAWYRYDDGFIYQVDPYSRRIVGMVPVSYGSYSVGYPVPAYASYGGNGGYAGYPAYQVPYAYEDLYFDEPGYNYHLAGGGIYQVDPVTQLVSALVGLVTRANFRVGQPLPSGYDTYNVPSQYRANYYDRPDALYRYDDGQIYQVDPRTRIVQAAIPLSYDGYVIGQPIPPGYPGYPVPEYYQGLYYASPDYDYRYYDGGIYQVDRDSQIMSALAALVTGNDLAVGGMLPVGYDAYNLPYEYRDRYQDGGENLYRYSDGRIYQVDAQTRLIQSIIDAVA